MSRVTIIISDDLIARVRKHQAIKLQKNEPTSFSGAVCDILEEHLPKIKEKI